VESDFWHQRWHSDRIGFHRHEINPHLRRFWERAGIPDGGPVLVPLCGKSHDLRWLADRGHPVIGVELSPVAVEAFFRAQGWWAEPRKEGAFERWEAHGVTLLCGDIFDLSRVDLSAVVAVYDRAALIALPREMRPRYARHLQRLTPAGASTLLVTLEYDAARMDGPPFPVAEQEVRDLYGAYNRITRLYTHDALADEPHFRDRGLDALVEQVYLLTPRTQRP
jgi:thiopurine S-methyltransferase